jgi:hypothetical protein
MTLGTRKIDGRIITACAGAFRKGEDRWREVN